MIHFELKCSHGHRFDGWFRSNDDFERQVERDLVTCSICGDSRIDKALMRPAVSVGPSRASGQRAGTDTPRTAGTVTEAASAEAHESSPEAMQRMKALWSALQAQARKVREQSEYVGPKFAEEARRIHYGEVEAKSVYGEASRDDVESLRDEGIVAVPLPPLPEDRN